jgi:hypothetical protein
VCIQEGDHRDDTEVVGAIDTKTVRTHHTQNYVDATNTIHNVLAGSIANANANGRAARAVHRHVAARNRQRWLSSLVNNVGRGRHVVLGADPIICIGDYRSSSTRVGQRGGGREDGRCAQLSASREWRAHATATSVLASNMVQLALNKLARDTRPVAFTAAAGVGAAARRSTRAAICM